MFLRRYTRTKAGKTYTYFALVESVRTEAGPRQHVVAHLGELNADQERRWQRTVVFHNRQGDTQQLRLFPDDDDVPLPDDPDIVRVRVGEVSWSNARCFGDVYLARWLWNLLDLDAIINRHMTQGKETVRPADVVAIEVINRLCIRAASSPWPNIGTHQPDWMTCSACPTKPSPKTVSIAPSIICSRRKPSSRTT